MLKMRKADFDLYSLDEKTENVFLNAPIDKMGILTAYINHAKSVKKPTKELVKEILCWRIKKNNYAVSENMRFDK